MVLRPRKPRRGMCAGRGRRVVRHVATPPLNHTMQVTLAPNQGTEIKVVLEKGKSVAYTWWTDGGKANFDVHGDSEEQKIEYHNYSRGAKKRQEGVIPAAFN